MKKLILIIPLLCLTACSSFNKVASAEAHQSAAMAKVTLADEKKAKAQKAKDSQIANLTQEVRLLLRTPDDSGAVVAANQLLGLTMDLAGAPSKNESQLESEVAQLLADKAKSQVQISKLQVENDHVKKDLDIAIQDKAKAQQQVAKTTTALYQTALHVAADDDTKSTIFHIMIGTVIFIVLMVCLRIFFTMTKTGATLAAKIP